MKIMSDLIEIDDVVLPTSPVTVDQEVILLTDTSSEDDDMSRSNSSSDSCEADASSSNNSDITNSASTTTQSNDCRGNNIPNQVIKLIESVREQDDPNTNHSESDLCVKKKLTSAFRSVESLQSHFEETQKVITTKDDQISELALENGKLIKDNHKLWKQLENKNKELERLRKRNVKLEEERSQQKVDVLPLGKIKSQVNELQRDFEGLVARMETEPVNRADPFSVQRKQDLQEFQMDVGELFNKVQHILREWERNQRDMEGELQSTKMSLQTLSDMVNIEESRRTHKRTASNNNNIEEPLIDFLPLAVVSECDSRTSQPFKKTTKTQMLPHPLLLPLTRLPSTSNLLAKTVIAAAPAEPAPYEIESLQSPTGVHQDIPHLSSVSLLSSPLETTSLLQANQSQNMADKQPSKVNDVLPGSSLNFQFHTPSTSYSSNPAKIFVPPVHSHDASATTVVKSIHRPASLDMPSRSQQDPQFRPLDPPLTIQFSSTERKKTLQFLHHKITASQSAKSQNSEGQTATCLPVNQRSVSATSRITPMIQIPASPFPSATQIYAISHQMPEESSQHKHGGGKNVCGVCQMSFGTLVQLKIHHTFVHARAKPAMRMTPQRSPSPRPHFSKALTCPLPSSPHQDMPSPVPILTPDTNIEAGNRQYLGFSQSSVVLPVSRSFVPLNAEKLTPSMPTTANQNTATPCTSNLKYNDQNDCILPFY